MTEKSWSELPTDLLFLIVDRLLEKDINSVRRVCTTWRSSIPIPSLVLPLLVSLAEDNITFNFNHPLYNTTRATSIPDIKGASIQSSKFGWLLMSKGKYAIFFFNPLTKEKIDLPDLPWVYNFRGIGFSSPPTSSECVILATTNRITEYCYIRHGEYTWNVFEANIHYPIFAAFKYSFFASYNSPVFHEGVFYVLDINRNLGIFDPIKDDWSVITTPDPCPSIQESYLAKCNDGIVAVFEGRDVRPKWVKVFKFDHSKKVWRKQSSLGDEMLFLSWDASFATTTNEKAKAFGLENIMYTTMLHENNCVFYSLVTSMFRTFLVDFAHADRCCITREVMDCTWIEPNFKGHSNEELKWCSPPSEDDEESESTEDDEESESTEDELNKKSKKNTH